jgi:DNA-binding XRE family transcriptional regulator
MKYFMKCIDLTFARVDNAGGDSQMATATQSIKSGTKQKAEAGSVASLRERLGVTQRVMATLLGVTERTLISLEGGREVSPSVQRRVTEIGRLYAELVTAVKPAAIGKWMVKPNDAFDRHSAVEMIAAGKIDRLWKMIFMLRSGVAS